MHIPSPHAVKSFVVSSNVSDRQRCHVARYRKMCLDRLPSVRSKSIRSIKRPVPLIRSRQRTANHPNLKVRRFANIDQTKLIRRFKLVPPCRACIVRISKENKVVKKTNSCEKKKICKTTMQKTLTIYHNRLLSGFCRSWYISQALVNTRMKYVQNSHCKYAVRHISVTTTKRWQARHCYVIPSNRSRLWSTVNNTDQHQR